MSALLLAPHADDETLFAFYMLLRDNAHVVVCLDSGERRWLELECAMRVADRHYTEIREPEKSPDWEKVRERIKRLIAEGYTTLIAPAYYSEGHEHHNEVALIAGTLGLPVTWYHTYRRGESRSINGQAIIATGAEMELKRRAMDCYVSQKEDPKTEPWFRAGWQIEYIELPR